MQVCVLSMPASYEELQTALHACEKSITCALKVEHRDKNRIRGLRTQHHEITAKLAKATPMAQKKDSRSNVQESEKEVLPKEEKKSFKEKIKEKLPKKN